MVYSNLQKYWGMLFKKLAISSWTETESGGKIKIMGKCLIKKIICPILAEKLNEKENISIVPNFWSSLCYIPYNAASQGDISSTLNCIKSLFRDV
jgi:hypothetical protein